GQTLPRVLPFGKLTQARYARGAIHAGGHPRGTVDGGDDAELLVLEGLVLETGEVDGAPVEIRRHGDAQLASAVSYGAEVGQIGMALEIELVRVRADCPADHFPNFTPGRLGPTNREMDGTLRHVETPPRAMAPHHIP